MNSKKLVRALLVSTLFTVPAQAVSAQLNIALTNSQLGTMIKQIQSQSQYQFFYDDELADTPIGSVNVSDSSVEEVLNKALAGKGISYKVDENIVYLSKASTSATSSTSTQAVKQAQVQITGRVIDGTGEPLIGVSILEKGTTNGTITDWDGNYTLNVSSDATLQFSYIGYKNEEIPVNGKTVIDLTMKEDTEVLEEVVVTALGIKREKKMLGYAVQELKSDELNKTGDPSVTSALQGKVAGLSMNTSATGLGGSTKITIRGNSSLTDNNQPLWIVDGVPFSDNSTSDASYFGGVDRGGASLDINPDDIESISVLKGPNAAALYGSRAGNGVILVTTKKGSKKDGFGVRYSGNFTWSKVAETLNMQERYGQGHINDDATKDNGQLGAIYSHEDSGSWGPVLNGNDVNAWNGESYAYSKYGNKLKDYFDTGFSQTHNVSVSNGTEKSHYRASFGNSSNKGVFPTEELTRTNVDLNAGTELNKYLSMDGKISLSRTKATNRPEYGQYGAINQLMGIPHNIRLDDLKQYSTEDHVHTNWYGPTAGIRNPYYIINQRHNSDERWRAFGYYTARINFTDWLHLSAKYAFDYYRTRIESTNAGDGINNESTPSTITNDEMNRGEENFFESNAEIMLMGDRQLTDNFRLGFTVGGNFMYQRFEGLTATVGNMVDKTSWMLNAANQINSVNETGYKRAMNSVFGSAQLAWKEYLSLDLTARNDWSSTLPLDNNSFFYPSANLSFVISDFVRSLDKTLPSWITFAKLRLSAAQVGKDTDPYQLYNTYAFKYDKGVLTPSKDNVKMNDQLKPEIATSYEAGLDMKFFNNRLGFDFTYYYNKTKNQIMKVPSVAPWSGGKWVNAGMITNQGVELMLYSTLVDTKDFTFDLNVNIAHNVSTVKELAPEDNVNFMYFNGDGNFPVNVGAVAGGKLGDIYAKNLYKRDENGNIIVNEKGIPQTETDENKRLANPIGNIQPKMTMSVSPTFTYKGVTLSAMFDMKFGGDIFSYSEMLATGNGLAKRTINRGEDNGYMMVFPGVYADGQKNTTPIKASEYYGSMQAEDFIYDASFIKLKELSIGYSFPSSLLKKTPLTSLNVSFVARNLCYLLKHTPGTSPEGGYDTTMFSQAIDYAALPFTRTFGLSVSLGF